MAGCFILSRFAPVRVFLALIHVARLVRVMHSGCPFDGLWKQFPGCRNFHSDLQDLLTCNFSHSSFARSGFPLLHLHGRSALGDNRTRTVASPLRLWPAATEMAVCPKYSILPKTRRLSLTGTSSLLLNLPKNFLRSVAGDGLEWVLPFLAGSGS